MRAPGHGQSEVITDSRQLPHQRYQAFATREISVRRIGLTVLGNRWPSARRAPSAEDSSIPVKAFRLGQPR